MNAQAIYNKGLCLIQINKFEDAIYDFSLIIKENPEDLESYYNKGICLMKINKIDEVISAVNYIHSKHVTLMGIVINDFDDNSPNLEIKYYPQLVKEYTGAKILGTLPHYENFENISPQTLIADILNRLNVEEIFSLKIAKLC